MIAAARKPKIDYADYLAGESASPVKHEFIDGEVFAMAGGTIQHAALAAAVMGTLVAELRGKPCRAYSSDLRIRIVLGNVSTYPDISVVCGDVVPDSQDPHSATNPKLLVEVLSDSTEGYDRGAKFATYRRISSLEEYVMVSQHEPLIERYSRNTDGSWTLTEFGPGMTLALDAIGCMIAVDEVYEGIALAPREPQGEQRGAQ
jgi:Uma2 family endonuclease